MAASVTSAAADPFTTLCSLLRPDEIITPQSPDYEASIQTWAAQKQARPRLAIRPTSVEALAKAISYLYTTSLDFAIYGQGFSSASAKDIVVNTSAFDDFHFDPQAEVVTIGAGQTWSAVYRKLAKAAPQYGSKNLSSKNLDFILQKIKNNKQKRNINADQGLSHKNNSRGSSHALCRRRGNHRQRWLFLAFQRVWLHL